ncbi:MAG: hypothetical protein IIV45_11340, partial [Lachnospiraceae bacterium]|nr:hypothetical protein [Lachnospiraceae bacterium]
METELIYWLFEYGKVFFAYTFLMFVWPSIMFNKHLKNKTRTYRFAFCTTAQVVLINMVILGLGLFHILNVWVVRVLFYGSLFVAVGYYAYMHKEKILHVHRLTQGVYSFKRFCQRSVCYAGRCAKKAFHDFWPKDRKRSAEYIILILVVIYGMIYFSYGAFQLHSFG